MFNHIQKVSAAAALLAALPVLASAQTVAYGTAPVSVTACNVTPQIDRNSFVGSIWSGSELLRNSNEYALNYVNTADVAATSVTFTLTDGKHTQNVTAKGNFAPGASNESSFTANYDAQPQTGAACTVAQVKFADGHVWQANPNEVSNR